ncbi:MAG: hypothetical protein M3Z92_02690 [Bacteroidota bacterium]|nr:hypothetical protein [Bacteroidota bacterium]
MKVPFLTYDLKVVAIIIFCQENVAIGKSIGFFTLMLSKICGAVFSCHDLQAVE